MFELHSRIDIHNPQLVEPRIILGSFPTYPYTLKSDEQAQQPLTRTNDLSFFYGSERNQFWHWYKDFVDTKTEKSVIESLKNSLKEHNIGITDAIYSCKRKGQSASDQHLTQRTYNHSFFSKPEKGKVVKILCTSKGVMNDMLLTDRFFQLHPDVHMNKAASEKRESELITSLKGKLVHKPVFRVLEVAGGGTIECASLPSPGSPFRSLKTFGFVTGNASDYLKGYLEHTFAWFLE